MSSFQSLLSRVKVLNEGKVSPIEKIYPGFQSKARALAAAKGAASGTREGKLALLNILFALDIIDEQVVRMFKNDPSVSRMVDYFEKNGIAAQIKNRTNDIEAYIADQLENKISFQTGQRSERAQQAYELNMLDKEVRAAKKAARLERKKETASAMAELSQSVEDNIMPLLKAVEGSFSSDYMLEILLDVDSDLSDRSNVLKYLGRFFDEGEIDVDGRSIDVVFGQDTKLGKLIKKIGAGTVEKQLAKDLQGYGGAGVVIHEPDALKAKELMNSLKPASEDAEDEAADELQEIVATGEGAKLDPRVAKAVDAAVSKVVKEDVSYNYTQQYMGESKLLKESKTTVSFRDKYKPKTSYQLEELRRYGL